eukprot:TRINITY_DN13959_c0_g1_i1.p1 TRINITY_DN13959_c0_g1~~TRINITY_DN13959_c0_g1_i1.p1  ORF type:complete len:357 (-),score=56.06 TRINITY_DN13959_c0_g1_i1:1349-2419(-)
MFSSQLQLEPKGSFSFIGKQLQQIGPSKQQQQLIKKDRILVKSIAEPMAQPAPNVTQINEATTELLKQQAHVSQLPIYEPSEGWQRYPGYLEKQQVWEQIRNEAINGAFNEPALASFLHSTILSHNNIEKTLAFILANKLASETLLGTHVMRLIIDAYDDDPDLIECMLADIQAVYERDPACDQFITPLLFFKGFQATQSYRISHYLWLKGRKTLAMAIQSRISDVFHVDIHPAAKIGRGILTDHATGVVIGETAVVGDNVSMLHHVTLGGSGRHRNGGRHPTIGHGVLLGAGVCVLGPVLVGNGSKVGAGSVVVSNIPCHSVVVGVPGKVIKRIPKCEPCFDMDQTMDFIIDFQI